MTDTITMLHGSGGSATEELINDIFASAFNSDSIDEMQDAAVVEGSNRIAVTTDSFVVEPLFYPGGDIGKLCVCGTVNDLLMRGAVPKYLTCGFILEEGLSIPDLKRIVTSLAAAANETKVKIVAGDTKVVPGSGGLFINTTGIGYMDEATDISSKKASCGDAVIVSGNMGDHHAAILASRLDIDTEIKSDNAVLCNLVRSILPYPVHTLRDVTRGGLATVLCELARSSRRTFVIEEDAVPVSAGVRDFCGIMGLDPLYMGNEGKLVCITPAECADEIVRAMRNTPEGADAAVIGMVCDEDDPAGHEKLFEMINEKEKRGSLYMRTSIGGYRHLLPLADEGLPRIC